MSYEFNRKCIFCWLCVPHANPHDKRELTAEEIEKLHYAPTYTKAMQHEDYVAEHKKEFELAGRKGMLRSLGIATVKPKPKNVALRPVHMAGSKRSGDAVPF